MVTNQKKMHPSTTTTPNEQAFDTVAQPTVTSKQPHTVTTPV